MLAYVLESRRINRQLPVSVFAILHLIGLSWSLLSMAIFVAQTADWLFLLAVRLSCGAPLRAGLQLESPAADKCCNWLRFGDLRDSGSRPGIRHIYRTPRISE